MKQIDEMTPDELMGEAIRIRQLMNQQAEALQAIYTLMYSKVRRAPADETTSSYLNVANAGRRFSGMVLQAVRRTASFDRHLSAAKTREAEAVRDRQTAEAEERKAREKKAAEDKAAKARRARLLDAGYSLPPEDDLIELYGEDT